MTTVHVVDGRRVAYVKGTAEVILLRTTLSADAQAEVVTAETAMEHDALRVLACAPRVLPGDVGDDSDAIEHDLEFLYEEATTMTMAGIVFAQAGAAMAWRTNRESVRTIRLLSNRMLLAGIVVEIGMVALLAYTPGLDDVFHTSGLSACEWLVLMAWPPLVLGAEELRKDVVRRRGA